YRRIAPLLDSCCAEFAKHLSKGPMGNRFSTPHRSARSHDLCPSPKDRISSGCYLFGPGDGLSMGLLGDTSSTGPHLVDRPPVFARLSGAGLRAGTLLFSPRSLEKLATERMGDCASRRRHWAPDAGGLLLSDLVGPGIAPACCGRYLPGCRRMVVARL